MTVHINIHLNGTNVKVLIKLLMSNLVKTTKENIYKEGPCGHVIFMVLFI